MFLDSTGRSSRAHCHIEKDKLPANRRYPQKYRMVWVAIILILLIVLAQWVGLLNQSIQYEQNHLLGDVEQKYVSLTGMVKESKNGQSYFFMETASGIHLYVTMPFEDYDAELQSYRVWYPAGTQLQVQGALSLPDCARNPGGFDQAAWLRSNETGLVLQADTIEPIAKPEGIWLVVYELHEQIERILYQALSQEQASLAMALLTGAKHRLDDAFYNMTQQMGIAHIFAVSGLHVGVIGAVVLFFFKQWGWTRSWAGFFVLGAGLGIYCMLAGLPASAIRAAGMILLSALAMRLYRPIDSINFLAFAAIVLLLDNPYLLWNAGFQLSFGVTLSLLLFVQPISNKLHLISNAKLRISVAVVLAAWIGSVPLTAWHFYTITPSSPIYNLLLVPLVSATVPMLLMGVCLAMLCPVGTWFWLLPAKILLWFLQTGTLWLYTIGEKIFGRVQWNMGRPDVLALLLYVVLVVLLWHWLHESPWMQNRHAGSVMMILLVMVVYLCIPKAPNTDTLLYLDTGQGSCALLCTTSGEAVLFDVGAQKQEVASVLAWYGINHLDAVIVSHCDTDHINGLAQVMQTVRIAQILIEPHQIERESMQEILAKANEKGILYRAIADRATLYLHHHSIDIQPFRDYTDSTNNTELTAVLHYEKGAVAFPGDLDRSAVERFVAMQDGITIWTVPHHGSRYSGSEALYRMLKQKGVQSAVISSGRNNHYGHPHQEVLQWMDRYQIDYYATAEEGAILFLLQ